MSPASPSRDDPLQLVGKTIDERYEVVELVDEGGYGLVYKARRVMWDKLVALKVIKQKSDDERKRDEATKAFIAESKVLSELSRKTTAIVQSFDIGTVTGPDGEPLLYTALEWLEGETLGHIIEREQAAGHPGWSLTRIVDILGPVAEALAVAHGSGVAHRDIKPANIFLVEGTTTDEATTKLLDFGVAKVVEDLGTGFDKTGHREGPYTPKYGAPEQFSKRHGSTGPWSDVYSLAMVCLELLGGRYPFDASSFGQLIFAVCDPDNRPSPRAMGLEVSEEVEQVFVRALALDTEQRPRNADVFWREVLEATGADSRSFLQTGRIKTLRRGDARTAPPSSREPSVARAARAGSGRWPLAAAAALLIAGALAFIATTNGDGAAPSATTATASAAVAPLARIDQERLASFAVLPDEMAAAHNPVTTEKIDLGRMLFFDARLSRGHDVSCNSCHALERYGVDHLPVSAGSAGMAGKRNALTVYNSAGAFAMMWDGSKRDVEEQASGPLLTEFEMAMSRDGVVAMLKSIPGYVSAFGNAFPGESDPVSVDNLGKAIGAFERRLVTPARWDTFLKGEDGALTDQEKRGFNAFVDVGCVTCHFGPYIGLTMFQKLGLVRTWPSGKDRGRYEVTKQDADLMMFRVPTLRNITETGPYFHDGSQTSLAKTVRMMAHHQLGKDIDDSQVDMIVAWLGTLTGTIPAAYIRKPALPESGPTTPAPEKG
jgi:cytochrome c peroxidase